MELTIHWKNPGRFQMNKSAWYDILTATKDLKPLYSGYLELNSLTKKAFQLAILVNIRSKGIGRVLQSTMAKKFVESLELLIKNKI